MSAAIVSHRGGALLWPENSRTAFVNTVALGADQLQVDVHPSADGRVVVIHDATLERTTDGTGPVAARPWAALRELHLKGTDGERIPSLEDVIAVLRPSPLVLRLEIKADVTGRPYPDLPARVVRVLSEGEFLPRTIVTAFAPQPLADFAALAPMVPRMRLIDAATLAADGLASLAGQARMAGYRGIGVRWSALDAAGVRLVQAAGLVLTAFGCNDEPAIATALALGVDEVMTDRPDLALRLGAALRSR